VREKDARERAFADLSWFERTSFGMCWSRRYDMHTRLIRHCKRFRNTEERYGMTLYKDREHYRYDLRWAESSHVEKYPTSSTERAVAKVVEGSEVVLVGIDSQDPSIHELLEL
jgi:hypothetical protein